MVRRQEPGWQFSTLYLVKDGLGIMLAAGGLAEDALREFYELEAVYLELLAGGGALATASFGAYMVARCLCGQDLMFALLDVLVVYNHNFQIRNIN